MTSDLFAPSQYSVDILPLIQRRSCATACHHEMSSTRSCGLLSCSFHRCPARLRSCSGESRQGPPCHLRSHGRQCNMLHRAPSRQPRRGKKSCSGSCLPPSGHGRLGNPPEYEDLPDRGTTTIKKKGCTSGQGKHCGRNAPLDSILGRGRDGNY